MSYHTWPAVSGQKFTSSDGTGISSTGSMVMGSRRIHSTANPRISRFSSSIFRRMKGVIASLGRRFSRSNTGGNTRSRVLVIMP